MSKKIELYYYSKNPENENFNIQLKGGKKSTAYSYANTFPLYNAGDSYKPIGLLKRFGTQVYLSDGTLGYFTQLFTIYFNDSNDTISFQIDNIDIQGSKYYKPGVPLNSVITSCSGSIWNNRGTVQILPFDNEIKTRLITVTLY